MVVLDYNDNLNEMMVIMGEGDIFVHWRPNDIHDTTGLEQSL